MMKDKFKLFLFSSWIINITKTHITHSFAAQFSHKAQSKKTCRHSFSVGGAPEPELPPKVLAMLLVKEMVLFLSLVGDIPLTSGHTPPCTSSDLDRWFVKEEPSSVRNIFYNQQTFSKCLSHLKQNSAFRIVSTFLFLFRVFKLFRWFSKTHFLILSIY